MIQFTHLSKIFLRFLMRLFKKNNFGRLSICFSDFLDHFDTALYGFLAPLMAPYFFSSSSKIAGIIAMYSVYIITWIARPLGGIFFGRFSMRFGERSSLLLSIGGVSLATASIGLIPSIPIVAPILLASARFLQSFCASGEHVVARYYILKGIQEKEQLKWSGYLNASTMLGYIVASFLCTHAIHTQIWREIFITGGVLGGLIFFCRIFLDNTAPVVSSPQHALSLKEVCLTYKKIIFFMIFIYGMSYMVFSMSMTVVAPYFGEVLQMDSVKLMAQTSKLMIFDFLLLLGMPKLISRYHPKKTMLFFCLFFVLGSFMLFFSPPYLYLFLIARSVMVMCGVGIAILLLPWTNQIYPLHHRHVIHTISYAIGSELFGRSTPAICFFIFNYTGKSCAAFYYVVFLMLIAVISYLFLTKCYVKNNATL